MNCQFKCLSRRLAVMLVAFTVMGSFAQENRQVSPADVWKLSINTDIEPRGVPAGRAVWIELLLSNRDLRQRTVAGGALFDIHRILLERIRANGAAEPTFLTRYGRSLIEQGRFGDLKAFAIPAGETVVNRVMLSRIFDVSVPGLYRVHVERLIPTNDGLMTLRSDAVEFRVNAAAE